VAIFNGGQRVVLPLSPLLQTELARLRGWRGIRVVGRWARSDEVRAERLTTADTHALVLNLRRLARDATAQGDQLYMWIDVDERALFVNR
ncbi:hypothetical protein Q9S36_51495, partial [Microbacterium sp. ARD31]|uniref:hypothetical protein n=1 Tax=Microbacterium sp. ARD31 TaxID=2962576 RepID=UPI002880D965